MFEATSFDSRYASLDEAEDDLRALLLELTAVPGTFWEESFRMDCWSPDWAEVTEGLGLDETLEVVRRWYARWREVITADQQRGLLYGDYTYVLILGYPSRVELHVRDAFNDYQYGPTTNTGIVSMLARRSEECWVVASAGERVWLYETALFGDPDVVQELIAAGDTALAGEVERLRLEQERREEQERRRFRSFIASLRRAGRRKPRRAAAPGA